MTRTLIAAAVGALLVVGPSAAHSPEQIIAARQASFALSAATFGAMKGAIDRGEPARSQAFAARALAKWAAVLPSMFPAGSGEGSTRAKAEIWTDAAGFEAKAAAYASATATLAEKAAADDAEGFSAQWQVVRETCGGCHATFRAE
jgi:cytochrome c556